MRRTLALLATASLLSGCWVFDEIDNAGKPVQKKSASPAKPAEPVAEEKPGPPTGSAWWSKARSLGRGPGGEASEEESQDPQALVSCRLGRSTRFMRRGDCISQGGSPAAS